MIMFAEFIAGQIHVCFAEDDEVVETFLLYRLNEPLETDFAANPRIADDMTPRIDVGAFERMTCSIGTALTPVRGVVTSTTFGNSWSVSRHVLVQSLIGAKAWDHIRSLARDVPSHITRIEYQ